MTDPIRLALTLATLYAAHQVADHWIQTHHQACSKSAPGRTGHLACLRHVITYTLTLAAGLGVLALLHPLSYSIGWATAGLAVNGATHYWADRRTPLRALAVALGKRSYWDEVPGGAYQLDQAWHHGWLWISALIIAT